MPWHLRDRRDVKTNRVEANYGRKNGKGRGGWEPFDLDKDYERTPGSKNKHKYAQPRTSKANFDGQWVEVFDYDLSQDEQDHPLHLSGNTLEHEWEKVSDEEKLTRLSAVTRRAPVIDAEDESEFPSLPQTPRSSDTTPRKNEGSSWDVKLNLAGHWLLVAKPPAAEGDAIHAASY